MFSRGKNRRERKGYYHIVPLVSAHEMKSVNALCKQILMTIHFTHGEREIGKNYNKQKNVSVVFFSIWGGAIETILSGVRTVGL